MDTADRPRPTTILGLHYNVCHNPSATLLRDGEVLAFAEEERFSRNKYAFDEFPASAIRYCLGHAGIPITGVDAIALGWDVTKYPTFIESFNTEFERRYGPLADFSRRWLWGNDRFSEPILVQRLHQAFPELSGRVGGPRLRYFPHHLCHAASAFYMSGFTESAVLTADGRGEEDTTHLWKANDSGITSLEDWSIPNGLGFFYTKFAIWFGFEAQGGEGKLMGLAAYGRINPAMERKLDQVFALTGDDRVFELNPDHFFRENAIGIFPQAWLDLFGRPLSGPRHRTFTPAQFDLAFAVQRRLELAATLLADRALQAAGSRRLCAAGGVFMNCKLNGHISARLGTGNYFVQPLASDAGVSLGAALLAHAKDRPPPKRRLETLYWGPSYSDGEIQLALQRSGLPFARSEDIAGDAALSLSRSQVVGWFQGRMEAGARALGGRSILGNPLDPKARDIINQKVKFREPWRPFCPSVLAQDASRYFAVSEPAPFMIVSCSTKSGYVAALPSVVHCDGSARIQTVTEATNPLYYRLLCEMKRLTGHGVVLNTSFNRAGEPMVNTPGEAIACFTGSGLDVLAIGNFLVRKDPGMF